MCVCVCVRELHFFIKTYLIKLYRHFLSTYICFDPFKSPYGCNNIRPELANKPYAINWFSSTFRPFKDPDESGVYIVKAIQALPVHNNFVRIKLQHNTILNT